MIRMIMHRCASLVMAVVSAIMGYRGLTLGDFAIQGITGAIAGGALGVVGVYYLSILFSVSREMIAPYAKPRRTRKSK